MSGIMKSQWAAWLLAGSLCANLGVVGAVLANRSTASTVPTVATAEVSEANGADGLGSGLSTPELVRKLNLSDDQRQQMARMQKELMTSTSALHRQAMQERRTLIGLLRAPEINQEATKQSLAQIQAIQAQTQQAVLEHVVAERKLLRPEQIESFNAIILPRVLGGVLRSGQAGLGGVKGSSPSSKVPNLSTKPSSSLPDFPASNSIKP